MEELDRDLRPPPGEKERDEMPQKDLSLNFIWRIRFKLWVEGNRLWAEGNKLWVEAILEVHGNIRMEWQYRMEKNDYTCVLETGEIFEPLEES